MKKTILLALLIAPSILFAQNFKITGEVPKTNPRVKKVALYYARNGQNILDSVDVQRNGTYTFQGIVSQPTRADILAKYDNGKIEPRMSRDLKTIFIEPGNININSTDSFSNATVTGSRSNVEFEKLQSMAAPYMNDMRRLSTQIKNANIQNAKEFEKSRLQKELDDINNDIKEDVYKKYFVENPNSSIALFALQQYAGGQMQYPQETQKLFNMLPQSVKESTEGKRFNQLINFTTRGEVGKTAPDFTQNDINGRPVRLASLRGNYVLLNFWASWCASCRSETYTLKKIDSLYGNKNLKIVSVSLDKPGERNAWLNAVKKDGMTWTNISDLQFWNNAVAVKYGVSLLPQNILIDPSGKIVGRNLRGLALEEKISELIK